MKKKSELFYRISEGENRMIKLYQKKPVLFSVMLIVFYCMVSAPIKENFGIHSIWSVVSLLIIAFLLTFFIFRNHLEKDFGFINFTENSGDCLYFIPLWIVSTGNFWGGAALNYSGTALICGIISMALVGYVEEVIFRGFLFKSMLAKDNNKTAIAVSAITFGAGHIINLFTGQTTAETVIQIFFAVAWGFIVTFVFYKSKSLIPCIIAHSFTDIAAEFSKSNPIAETAYIIVTIIIAVVYCVYLSRLKKYDAK